MSESEKFLERWSRRKREAVDQSTPADAEAAEAKGESAAEKNASPDQPKQDAAKVVEEPFDVSTLPPIESITATSDVRAFMRAGVPLELRHAALRRAWSADTDIRDFIGLVENGWDFNDPDGVPGFGPLPEGVDIKGLLEQAIGTPQPDTDSPAEDAARVLEAQNNSEKDQPPAAERARPAHKQTILQSNDERTALQNESQSESKEQESLPSAHRRGHGGALPK